MRPAPRSDPFKKTIDEWLLEDLEAPPKQRYAVQRILNRLRQECGAEIAYTTVWDYVSRRRRQIAVAAGAAPAAGFVIRHNQPGMDAEVDFGEAGVDLAGERTKCSGTEGTKQLVHVLLVHRHLAHRDVIAGIRSALSAGAHTGDIVALEARKPLRAMAVPPP
ncbi:hypothetical protein [Streptomyces sp. NPDC001594]|uniref:hypothetical protein n=1 Tax=Streptomyces sp. NPDC001594 TaxID=3364590 RepID=UPI0036909D81